MQEKLRDSATYEPNIDVDMMLMVGQKFVVKIRFASVLFVALCVPYLDWKPNYDGMTDSDTYVTGNLFPLLARLT